MSELPQVQNADRPSPIRKAAPTRRSASRPGDRIASARDVARYFREDCRTLRDSLQLEMVVAQYCLRLSSVLTPEGVPAGDALSAGVIAELERAGDPLSHVILRTLAHLGDGEVKRRSADAVARLGERGVGVAAKFADATHARAIGAWRERGEGGEYAFFIEFEHSPGRRHALALFVEPRHGGVIKHLFLMHSMGELDPDDPFHPSTMETVE